MQTLSIKRKPCIVGIMGSHRDDNVSMDEARILGKAIAERGHVLLTGGGTGIMHAASKGAYLAGGLVIGVLPNDKERPLAGYPNEFIDIPIYTGMYEARIIINAKTPDLIIALAGGPGTLSEMVLALKGGIPVIDLHAPRFAMEGNYRCHVVDSAEEAIEKMDEILSAMVHDQG